MALCAFLGIYYLSDPSLFLNVSPTFEFRNADDERKRKMWFEIADGNRTFTFSFAAQQYTQNSQNSTPNSIFKKKCTIFVYFGIYLYFFFWFFVNVNQHYRFWQPSFRRSPNGGGCGKKKWQWHRRFRDGVYIFFNQFGTTGISDEWQIEYVARISRKSMIFKSVCFENSSISFYLFPSGHFQNPSFENPFHHLLEPISM